MDDTLQILQRIRTGDPAAEAELYALVEEELRRRAGNLMRNQRAGHTLQPTALINEAWIKLSRGEQASWEDRSHFLRTATRAMQSILVDHARGRLTEKRGGAQGRVQAEVEPADPAEPAWRMIALSEAMERLEQVDAELHRVAQLRVFGGLSHQDIADLSDVSVRTVERTWRAARAWLARELGEES